jgi:hypothetical protein
MRSKSERFQLEAQALLYYTNPVRKNDQHGAIFLWTASGRPAVIASIWSAINQSNTSVRHLTHEWHSLVETPDVAAMRGGQVLWTPGEAGIEWSVLPDVPTPSTSRTTRLVQLRSIARRLTARITAEEEGELRLMPQPLYRYPPDLPGTLDGAIFSFALTTDPEIVVLVEATPAKPQSNYRIAVARFGNLAMSVRDGERVIFTCSRGKPGRSEGKYFLFFGAEQMPVDGPNASKP